MPALKTELLDVSKRCIAVRTAMTARAVSRLFDNSLRSCGLTGTQFSLLIAIGSGDFPSMAALGDVLSIDRSTLSRNFRPLLDTGLIEKANGHKGRSIPLRLTDAGMERLREAYPLWEKAQKQVEEYLTQEDLKSGRGFLRSLREAATNT